MREVADVSKDARDIEGPAKRGTFCGMIGKQLVVSCCPLPKGTCMWKHRVHGGCKYPAADEQKEWTPLEFCRRVGLKISEVDKIPELKQEIFAAVKAAIAH